MAIPNWKLAYIDIPSTLKDFGYTSINIIRPNDKVNVKCTLCPNSMVVSVASIRVKKPHTFYTPICKSCQQKRTWSKSGYNSAQREKIAKSIEAKWKDDNYRKRIQASQSTASKLKWSDDSYRQKITKSVSSAHATIHGYTEAAIRNINSNREVALHNLKMRLATDQYRQILSEKSKANWQKEEYRSKVLAALNSPEVKNKISHALQRKWSDPNYANKIASNNKSCLEDKLASILDDLHINYQRQHHVGFWPFDFLIPHYPKDLLIEVHGDYWHGTKHDYNRSRDQAKANYIQSYHADNYELKVLWEHEFLASDRVLKILKTWLQLESTSIVDYSLPDVRIALCDSIGANLFFSKYHYYANGGRKGVDIGCYYGDKLIACARYCSPTRLESAERLNYHHSRMKELTRFAIHPQYQKKNLASYFLTRTTKFIEADVLLTFADSTYGHKGTIYKAAGWKLDGTIKPDYYYADKNGYIMHKRTLWGHASKMRMTENDFALKYGYIKKYGKEKYRYLYFK